MATWPATLPAPSVSGYEIAPVDPVMRTDMEVGAVRARRRSSARNDKVKLSWVLTDAQMATFRSWFDDAAEAAGGAAWFNISLPVGDGGLSAVEARFASAWKAPRLDGPYWSVDAEVEVR